MHLKKARLLAAVERKLDEYSSVVHTTCGERDAQYRRYCLAEEKAIRVNLTKLLKRLADA